MRNNGHQVAESITDDLLARIAWLYYIEGLTQNEVAERLRTSRLRINRLLARCHREGVVRITIHSPHLGCLELERGLTRRFGLKRAMVVPSPVDPGLTQDMVGAAIGHYLNNALQPGMRLGMVTGRTLYGALRTLRPREIPDLEIVSLVGGLTRRARALPYEVGHRLAELFGASCYYVPAPQYAESERARDEFMSQGLIREVMRKAETVDLAIVGAGRLTSEGVIRSQNLLDAAEIESLQQAGAVGSLVGLFIEAGGLVVEHPLNRRAVGLSLEKLHGIPEVVVCGGGSSKAPVLAAAIAGGYADMVITDEVAARMILGVA